MPKLLFFITEDWYFFSHRLPLAKAAIKAGFDVMLLTNVTSHADQIRAEGIRVIPIGLQRRSLNPLREMVTLCRVMSVYRTERPDLVHHVAMKPVLYGGLAAWLTGVPRIVNALAGMGYLFISQSVKAQLLRTFVTRLFRCILNRENSRLILQNPDDVEMVVSHGLAAASLVRMIQGSGVDVSLFSPAPEAPLPVTVILPARMLVDKGVLEFVEAARILSRDHRSARFILVGMCDPENPAAVTEDQLRNWQQEGVVEWWGHCSDMPEVLSRAHIVCLPSYREGLPKSLLEAAACAKPIVATDVPGCREIVHDSVNGLLVPARDSGALAEALRRLIDDRELRGKMGAKGREMVLNEFSEEKVTAETMAVYRELLSR